MLATTAYLDTLGPVAGRAVGYSGSSTGTASALAAAQLPRRIGAVVPRGGRSDLAGFAPRKVRAATLPIVGRLDENVLLLNHEALELLPGPKSLALIANATHLFEEPGTLDEVARLAASRFREHLLPVPHSKRANRPA